MDRAPAGAGVRREPKLKMLEKLAFAALLSSVTAAQARPLVIRGGRHGEVAGIDPSLFSAAAVPQQSQRPAPRLRYAAGLPRERRGSLRDKHLRDKKSQEQWKRDLRDGVAVGAVGSRARIVFVMGRTIASALARPHLLFASATMALAQYSNSFHGGGGHGDVAGIDLSHYTPEAVAARQAPLSGPAPPLKYATVLGDVRGSLRDKKAHEHWKGDLMDGVAGGAVGAGCGVAYKMGRTIASTRGTNAVFASATIALAQYANVIHIDTSRARELVGGVAPAAATAFERYRPAPKVLWKDLEARARDLEARARRNEHRAAGVVAGFVATLVL